MAWQAAIPVITSVLGEISASGARRDANDARNAALAEYLNISVPDVEKMKLQLDQMQSVGEINPELQALFELGPSALENVNVDPRLRQNQLQALEQFAGLAKGELTQADLAGFELAKREAAAMDQAKQGQILQEMQARGQGGSGAELIARLKSSQSSADRLSNADLEQAKAIQNARLSALQQQANLSGSLRQQDYGEASNLAQQQDRISQFNTQSKQQQNASNVGIQNQAQMANLQNRQNIANANVGLRNQQQQYNKELAQRDYNNRMQLAQSRANARTGQASALDRTAEQTSGAIASIGQGLGTAYNTYADQELKKQMVSKGMNPYNKG